MLKLPVKPLSRFKCVSKSWLSKISSPEFAKTQLKSSHSPSPQFLIFEGNGRGPEHPPFTSITFDEHGRVQETVKLGFTHNGGPINNVVGVCNGLVCFSDEHLNFTVCNPVTSECIKIPAISSPNFDPITVITSGFGYVSSVDDYKIVCLIGILDDYFNEEDIDLVSVNIFSVRRMEWQEVSCAQVYGVGIVRLDVPAMVDETMYWFSANVNVVIGVELVSGEVSAIPMSFLPWERLKVFRTKDGRLGLRGRRQAWVLNNKEEGGNDGWTKLYDVNGIGEGMLVMCVCETTGKWFVHSQAGVGLLDPTATFNSQYQGQVQVQVQGQGQDGVSLGGASFTAWRFKMSLLSPILI